MAPTIPPFSALPLDKSGPEDNAWGLWGDKDQVGRLNLLTPEVIADAAKEVKEGRQEFYHHMHHKTPRCVNDDILLFNTQCGTQWDGLRHFAYQDAKKFYSGFTQNDLMDTGALGIDIWVDKGGIVGRGVLLDYAAFCERHKIPLDPLSYREIPVAHLKQLVAEEGIEFKLGDILFIRSGFTAAYEALTASEEEAMPQRRANTLIGVESTHAMMEWIWENGFSAVAGDMPGFEVCPIWESKIQLHQWLLAGWGMPIGEMFYLEELAKACQKSGRKTFFLSSVPLKVPGGVASPPNAIAIL